VTRDLFRPVLWFGATRQPDKKGFHHGTRINFNRQRTQGNGRITLRTPLKDAGDQQTGS
jgi:hypothetical protein